MNWIKERCPSHQVLLPSTKTSHPHYTKWTLWIKMEGANIVWRNNCTQVLVLISRVLLHQRQHIVEIKSPSATGLKFPFCSPHFLQLKTNIFLAMASFSRLSGNFKEQWKKHFTFAATDLQISLGLLSDAPSIYFAFVSSWLRDSWFLKTYKVSVYLWKNSTSVLNLCILQWVNK